MGAPELSTCLKGITSNVKRLDTEKKEEVAELKAQLEAAEVQRAVEVAELNTKLEEQKQEFASKLEASMKETADLKQLLKEGGIIKIAEEVKEKDIKDKEDLAQTIQETNRIQEENEK